MGGYYVMIDVNTSQTSEVGARIPSWPSGRIIIIIIILTLHENDDNTRVLRDARASMVQKRQ
jgi:hypothetical protein